MDTAEPPFSLTRLRSRQSRPATGDVYRIKVIDGPYYFGVVVDGDFTGPMGPGAILSILFSGASDDGEAPVPDELVTRPLLIPPFIVNQRPWTSGYAEKLALKAEPPPLDYVFWRPATGTYVDVTGQAMPQPPTTTGMIGEWGVGNEFTLSDDIVTHVGGSSQT